MASDEEDAYAQVLADWCVVVEPINFPTVPTYCDLTPQEAQQILKERSRWLVDTGYLVANALPSILQEGFMKASPKYQRRSMEAWAERRAGLN